MIRLLASVSLLMFLSFAAAQPIDDYTVVCRVTAADEGSDSGETTPENDGETAAIEVDEEADGDEVIGVASNVDGTWHVSLDRDREASCEGDVVLVPYGDEEDAELDADVSTDEGGSTTVTINGPVESDGEDDGDDETAGEDAPEPEPSEVDAVEVPDVAIEGKQRARENRNEAWDRRRGPPDWAGGDDEDEAEEEDEVEEDGEDAEASTADEAGEEDSPEPSGAAGDRNENGDRGGPPDFAGPPNGDDEAAEEDGDDDEGDDERRGPPEGRGGGGPPDNGGGPPDSAGRP